MKALRAMGAATVIALAALVGGSPARAPLDDAASRLDHQRDRTQSEVKVRFHQAVVMLHAKEFDHAVTALHRVLELAPRMPEAHVNMGFALLGQQQARAADGFFRAAIALRPQQANAYYGLAMAAEQQGDYETALGGMRSYLHLAKTPDDAQRAKARAALWEWEEKLGRHGKPVPVSGKVPANEKLHGPHAEAGSPAHRPPLRP